MKGPDNGQPDHEKLGVAKMAASTDKDMKAMKKEKIEAMSKEAPSKEKK